MTRKMALVFVALVAVAAVALPACAADVSGVLSLVPDDAVVVVASDSLSGFESDLAGFIDSVSPGSSAGLVQEMHKALTLQTGIETGLDFSGAAAVVLIVNPPAGQEQDTEASGVESGEAATEDADYEPVCPIGVMPLADETAWRVAMGAMIAKDGTSGFETIQSEDGPVAYFIVRNGCIVASDKPGALKAYSANTSAGVSPERRARIAGALESAPLVADFSVKKLREIRPDLADKIDVENLPMPTGQQGKAELFLYAKILKDLMNSADTLLVEVSPSSAGIRLASTLTVGPDSMFAPFFAAQGRTSLAGLSELPIEGPCMGAMTADLSPLVGYIKELNADYVRAMAGDAAQEDIDAAVTAYDKMLDDSVAVGLMKNVIFSIGAAPGSARIEMAGIYSADDVAKAVSVITDGMTALYETEVGQQIAGMSGFKPEVPEVTDATIAGTPVKVITQTVDAEGLQPHQAAALNAILGDAMVTRIAAKNDKLLIFLSGDETAMEKMLTGAAGAVDMPKVERSLEPLGGAPSGVLLLSIPEGALWGVGFMSAIMTGGQAGAPEVQVPPTSRFVAVTFSFRKSSMRMAVNVPSDQINAARMVAMQATMMMQQQQGGAGAAPGEEAPPWTPEVPEE